MAHSICWLAIFADTPDVEFAAEIDFWSVITGAAAEPAWSGRPEFVALRPARGERVLSVQRVGHDAARWHPDLYVSDVAAAVAYARTLGAGVTREDGWFTALTSPTGIPFCLVRASDENGAVPPAVTWTDSHRSELDQICLDIPVGAFDTEASFWARLTGWPLRDGERPEFGYLQRPADQAVRILLQRLDRSDPGPARAHADLATDDRVAETARHVAAGAVVVEEFEQWTVLRDPAGLGYCITDRRPRD